MSDTTSLYVKIPPNAPEAEQNVLGSVLLDSQAINLVVDRLRSEHFYSEVHKRIYDAILDLSSRAQPIDLITLQDALRKTGQLELVGGLEYLVELAEKVVTTANLNSHATLIREKAMLRAMIKAGLDISAEGYEEPPDIEEYIDRSEKRVFDVAQDKIQRPYVAIQEVVNEAIKRIEELDKKTSDVTGIASCYYDLDHLTSGFHPGELTVLAARPSMGKTSLALNIALNAALEARQSVGIFSLEMSRQELVIRMLCSLAHVDSQKFRRGRLDHEEWLRLSGAADKLYDARIYLDDSSSINYISLRSKARRMKAMHGLDMVIVDYLQLMQAATSGRESNREQEIAQTSRALKGLAKDLSIPVITLSQLNRDLEKRADKRPQLSDLRESGAIEQDADNIIFIYRDVVYNPENTAEENIAEIILAKQRAGPTGVVKLRYAAEWTLFQNMTHDEEFDPFAG